MTRAYSLRKLAKAGFKVERSLFCCAMFNPKKCPMVCKYAFNFRLDHVYTNWRDYAHFLAERMDKDLKFGYIQTNNCPHHDLVRLLSV